MTAAEGKDLDRVYAALFATPQGKLVLEDLQKLWRLPPASLESAAMAHIEGQRHVVRYIEGMIKKGSKE